MDEMDETEDERTDAGGVPFIADPAFLFQFGRRFRLSFSNDNRLVLTALGS